MYENNYGYMMLSVYDNGERILIGEHQLNALINNSLKDIFNKDNVVHHENELPLDNSVENLKVMSKSEHDRLHKIDKKPNNFNPCIRIRKYKCKKCKQEYTWLAYPYTKNRRIILKSVDLDKCIEKVIKFIQSEENTLGYTSYQVIGDGDNENL